MGITYQFQLKNLEEARDLDNYKVIDTDKNNRKCIVFFSGNGLYFPNTESQLDRVVKSDRYEWDKIYPKNFQRIIFIRDVYKQWYVKGINNKLDTVAKVADLVVSLTKGYESIFVGSSAGGYAAVLFGNLCNAKRSISLSGQFNLMEEKEKKDENKILNEFDSEDYFCIENLENKDVVYFNSASCSIDDYQKDLVRKNNNIIVIEINSSKHGVPFLPFALKNVLNLSIEDFRSLSKSPHNPIIFSLRYCHWPDFFIFLFYSIRRIRKYIRQFARR